jgi:hypothetical protein
LVLFLPRGVSLSFSAEQPIAAAQYANFVASLMPDMGYVWLFRFLTSLTLQLFTSLNVDLLGLLPRDKYTDGAIHI